MAFPTLSVNPDYPIEEAKIPSSIKSNFESGHQLARSRFTRDRNIFQLNYRLLSNADKLLLAAHMDEVKDVDSFTWTHPISATSYTVRYETIPQFQYIQYQRWNVNFKLVQV